MANVNVWVLVVFPLCALSVLSVLVVGCILGWRRWYRNRKPSRLDLALGFTALLPVYFTIAVRLMS